MYVYICIYICIYMYIFICIHINTFHLLPTHFLVEIYRTAKYSLIFSINIAFGYLKEIYMSP